MIARALSYIRTMAWNGLRLDVRQCRSGHRAALPTFVGTILSIGILFPSMAVGDPDLRTVAFRGPTASHYGNASARTVLSENLTPWSEPSFRVVELHLGRGMPGTRGKDLAYRVGLASLGVTSWEPPSWYAEGDYPDIEATDDGIVIEVHQLPIPGYGLYFNIGRLDGAELIWDHDEPILYDEGYRPRVAVNNRGFIIETHGVEHGGAYRIGHVDNPADALFGDPQPLPAEAGDPTVAINNDGVVLFVWSDYSQGIAQVGYRLAQLVETTRTLEWISPVLGPLRGHRPDVMINDEGLIAMVSQYGQGVMSVTGHLAISTTATYVGRATSGEIIWHGSPAEYAEDGYDPRVTGNEYLAVQNHDRWLNEKAQVWSSTSLFTDRMRWMEDELPTIGSWPLRLITMPMAHDAGTRDLAFFLPTPFWCPAKEGWAKLLLESLSAPIAPRVVDMARVQNLSIAGQLAQGVRALDLRPMGCEDCRDVLGDFGAHHTYASTSTFHDMLRDVARFCSSTNHELVILRLHMFCDLLSFETAPTDGMHRQTLSIIDDILGPWLYRAPDCNLNDLALEEVVRDGSRVIVAFGEGDSENHDDYSFEWLQANWNEWSEWRGNAYERRFWPSHKKRDPKTTANYSKVPGFHFIDVAANKQDVDEVWAHQQERVFKFRNGVPGASFLVSWHMYPEPDDPARLDWWTSELSTPDNDMEDWGRDFVPALGPFMYENRRSAMGLIQLDYVENTHAADLVIERNRTMAMASLTLTCPDNITVECSAEGGVPKSELTDWLASVSPHDPFDPAPSVVNDAPEVFSGSCPSGGGATVVTWTATSTSGHQAQCSATVTVLDTTPPQCDGVTLWPPTRKEDMTAEIRASDACDPDPEVTVISIVRNAPAAGEGGRAPEDIQGTRLLRDDTALEPQAVPFWEDRGQLHTVTYQITDCAGNTTKASTEVVMEYSREGAPSGEDVADGIAPLPESLIIGAIHPNPSNASTQIDFSLPASGNTRLEIFDIQGRRVATLVDGELPAGHHHAGWSGRDDRGDRLALGVYLVRLNHNGGTVVKKLVRIE